MKILIVSYFFPPFNQVGAVRVGKYAKYLTRMGHDVHILACEDLPLPDTLQVEIDASQITRTRWFDVNWPVRMLMGNQRVQTKGYEVSGAGNRWLTLAKRLYQYLFHFPDAQIGWYPHAKKAGADICQQWKPDVIYASALPVTSMLIAGALSRKYNIPWVAEFRDLWADNHNRRLPVWRRWIEHRLERRLIHSASGLVTVSEPLAETLRSKYMDKQVLMLPNGFDPEDYDKPLQDSDGIFSSESLNLLYTGMIYKEKYDLHRFFHAMALTDGDTDVHAHFFGRYIGSAAEEAERSGVNSKVYCHEPVGYERSVSLQRSSDILLMFLWNDPGQKGVYTGKLFEYLAARRPILAIGGKDSLPARLILERQAGFVSEDPAEIADWLRQQWAVKKRDGVIPPLDDSAAQGFSRAEQAKTLAGFIQSSVRVGNSDSDGG